MLKVHLDTDLGGDIDDLAALALLLKWPGAEITGITTVAEEGGRRAGYARYALRLAGREAIPVAAGADVSTGHYRYRPDYYPEADFWPEPAAPAPGEIGAALALLKESIEQGAVVVAVGQCTNLALLERAYPGILGRAEICLLGGYIYPPRRSRCLWDNAMDYNFQLDVASAEYVLARCRPTLVPLHVTVETSLRRSHLPLLEAAGPLGALLARQGRAFDRIEQNAAKYGAQCEDLPDDFINHLYDPLACAVALGWDGVTTEDLPLCVTVEEGLLYERVAEGGKPTRVVTAVDGEGFDRLWLEMVTGDSRD
jgi:purine nucleosidase